MVRLQGNAVKNLSECLRALFINNAISLMYQRPIIHSWNLFFMALDDGAKKSKQFLRPIFVSEGAGGAWF